jgi:hypothetical protein
MDYSYPTLRHTQPRQTVRSLEMFLAVTQSEQPALRLARRFEAHNNVREQLPQVFFLLDVPSGNGCVLERFRLVYDCSIVAASSALAAALRLLLGVSRLNCLIL